MKSMCRSAFLKKSNDHGGIVLTAIMGMILGYFLGVSFPYISFPKINLRPSFLSPFDMHGDHHERSFPENLGSSNTPELPTVYVPTNPRGGESLPPAIVVSETDLYLRKLWGKPSEDLKNKPKYLVTFTVGWAQRNNIDAAVNDKTFLT